MSKEITIEFVTMNGRTLRKTVKAIDYEDACNQLDKRYVIAYFGDWIEGNIDDFANEFDFSH